MHQPGSLLSVCARAHHLQSFFFLADFTHDGAATSHTAENWLIFIATAIWLSGGAVGCTLNLHPGRCFCCCVGSLMSHNQQAHLSSSRKLKSRFPAEFISICTVSTAKNTTSAYREQECVIINENMITTNKVSLLNSPNEKQVQLRPSKSEFSSFHPHQMCIMEEKSLKFRCCDLKSVIASGFKRSMNWLKRS